MLDFGDGRVTFRMFSLLPLGLDHVLTSHVIGIRRGDWTGIADCLFVDRRVVWLAQGRERAERVTWGHEMSRCCQTSPMPSFWDYSTSRWRTRSSEAVKLNDFPSAW